jgi:hypothetical protein
VTPEQRQAALQAVLAGDPAGWEGLPDDCTPADFKALSSGGGAAAQGRLSGNPTELRDYQGHPGPLRVFFDDAPHAYLVRADWPQVGAGPALHTELGEPEARLIEPARIPGTTQIVWAARGLTAYVTGSGEIRGLALYRPTSADYYRLALGGDDEVPYRPYRRSPENDG